MDIVLLIDKYLSDKKHLVTENCSFNVVGETIHRWDFANIPCPTMDELLALQPEVESAEAQKATNQDAQSFLDSTDWKVLRHRDQQDLGLPTSLTAEEFQDLLRQRQMAREAIIR